MADTRVEQHAEPGVVPSANADWRVTDDGLEHRGTGYFIAAQALAARRVDGFWEWPLHLAEKRWCAPRPFREAFLAALDHFGIARDEGLTRSFALALSGAAAARGGTNEGLVALADLVRPRSAERKRAGEARQAVRGSVPVRARVAAAARA